MSVNELVGVIWNQTNGSLQRIAVGKDWLVGKFDKPGQRRPIVCQEEMVKGQLVGIIYYLCKLKSMLWSLFPKPCGLP